MITVCPYSTASEKFTRNDWNCGGRQLKKELFEAIVALIIIILR